MTIVVESSSYYKRDSEMTEVDTGSTINEKVERAGGGGVIEEKMHTGLFRVNDFVISDNTREFVQPADLQQKDVGNNLADDKGIFVVGNAVECHWMECSSDEVSPHVFIGSAGGTPTGATPSHSQVRRRGGERLDKLD